MAKSRWYWRLTGVTDPRTKRRIVLQAGYNLDADEAVIYRLRRAKVGKVPPRIVASMRSDNLRVEMEVHVRFAADGGIDRVEIERDEIDLGLMTQRVWGSIFAIAGDLRAESQVPVDVDRPGEVERRERMFRQALNADGLDAPRYGTPGRRGFGDEFYRQLGRQVDAMRRAGIANPAREVTRLRDGLDADNPDDVAQVRNWIRTAREKGFCKPGKPGRPKGGR